MTENNFDDSMFGIQRNSEGIGLNADRKSLRSGSGGVLVVCDLTGGSAERNILIAESYCAQLVESQYISSHTCSRDHSPDKIESRTYVTLVIVRDLGEIIVGAEDKGKRCMSKTGLASFMRSKGSCALRR